MEGHLALFLISAREITVSQIRDGTSGGFLSGARRLGAQKEKSRDLPVGCVCVCVSSFPGIAGL